jgi:predicted transcriptional regulator YheO
MDENINELIEELLETIGSMLYQDNKYSEKEMAEKIVKVLEDKYDLK